MTAMNQIIIEGNVVRDSVIRVTPKGTRVVTIPIASNRYYKDANGEFQSDVSFFDVQAWGQSFCEKAAKHALKGRGIRVVGRLKQDRWNGENGKRLSKIYIVADHIDFKPSPSAKETQTASAKAVKEELGNLAEAREGLSMECENSYIREDDAALVF